MEKDITRLYMNDMTQQKMYKIFGLQEVKQLEELNSWLANLPTLNEAEKFIGSYYQDLLLENINAWNEHELSLNFIGPIFGAIKFTVKYKLNWFSQRLLSCIIGAYELIGKPDGTLSKGYHSPEIPYFCFQEFKKDINSSGDPMGQNLAAMLAGQQQNEDDEVVYGCYVVGRNWYFMVLKDKEFAISKSFSADDEEIFEIIKILKALRHILYKRLGLKHKAIANEA